MILSHRHRFLFIKTMKTAGTSIEVFLSRYCGEEDVVTPIEPPVDGHRPRNHAGFFNHMPASQVRERVGELVWGDYFKFCVERDPWEKTLSYFHMAVKRGEWVGDLDGYLSGGDLPINHPLYTDAKGRVIVDEIVRYETLGVDLARVFQRIGIPFSGDLGVRAKGDYRMDRTPAARVFTPAQARIVERRFAWEIEHFGYALARATHASPPCEGRESAPNWCSSILEKTLEDR